MFICHNPACRDHVKLPYGYVNTTEKVKVFVSATGAHKDKDGNLVMTHIDREVTRRQVDGVSGFYLCQSCAAAVDLVKQFEEMSKE